MTRAVVAAALATGVLTCSALTGCGDSGGGDTTADPSSPPADRTDAPDPGPAPAEHGLDAVTLDAAVAGTARVSGIACGRLSEGSGFAVADDVFATNAHVVLGVDEIRLDLADGRRVAAAPIAFDARNDLALLRTDGVGVEPLRLNDAEVGTVGALIGWEAEPAPDPTPFRVDRRLTARIDIVGGTETVRRPAWLLAAPVESADVIGDVLAVTEPQGPVVAVGDC